MSGKISVSGEVHLEGFEVLPAGARGAAVLVVGPGGDAVAASRLAPAAVMLLVDATPGDVGRVLDETLWPRPRVIGVRRDDVPAAVRAVLGDGDRQVRVTLADGEREATLAPGGISALG